jgi:excinuclease ABC subunit A
MLPACHSNQKKSHLPFSSIRKHLKKDNPHSQCIQVKGARQHNLQNLDIDIPRDQLVVITGVSGSGKSSLAFDTLYAEGYRKYMDSLSVRTRGLLDQLPKPDIDYVRGLSPVIAIEQRTGTGSNPRSTVATVSEIADYARLLWMVAGDPECPECGGKIASRSLDDCVNHILREPEGSRLMLLAPFAKVPSRFLDEQLPSVRQRGFQRIRINGEIHNMDDLQGIPPSGNADRESSLDIIVDRIVVRRDQQSRIADSLELAFNEGHGTAIVLIQESRDSPFREYSLSQRLSCVSCSATFDAPTPRLFSWNHPDGACPTCHGVGETWQFQEELLIPDPSVPLRSGAVKGWKFGGPKVISLHKALIRQLCEELDIPKGAAWQDLDKETKHILLHGGGTRQFRIKTKTGRRNKLTEQPWYGILADMEETLANAGESLQAQLMAFQLSSTCPLCEGLRLNKRARSIYLQGKSFPDFLSMTIGEAKTFIQSELQDNAAFGHLHDARNGLGERLRFLEEVGLHYLTLDRAYSTLSGGEMQRLRLATQLGMGLVGVVYVLDEPSIGLHPQDNLRLVHTIQGLRDRGNSLLVVEHDAETMLAADSIIELGPGAGTQGGNLVFQGTPDECKASIVSRTGAFLSGRAKLGRQTPVLSPEGRPKLTVHGATENNLRDINASFPVGLFSVICGVSGSGKSTLINHILSKAAAWKLNRAKQIPGKHKKVEGLQHFESCVRVTQEPIGRSPKSNPATFVKVFDLLRGLYAKTQLSKLRGYDPGRFSFNVRGGRCERCQGDGVIRLDMQFLADTYIECPSCNGKRYNRETLDVTYKGLDISQVLDLTISEAKQLFRKQPPIARKLETLDAVGLGYLHLGQPAPTLSGGEAQRLKLSLELSKRNQGNTLYILDEPTTGLHWDDIQRLLDLLLQLRDAGNTILVIEHNPDLIAQADWAVELGPGGGAEGGRLLYEGTLAGLAGAHTPTGKFLANNRF